MRLVEEVLIEMMTGWHERQIKAIILQTYIAEIGPLSEECAAKVRELLKEET